MTRRETLQCAHEPFGDSFYYGPERLSERYEADEEARISSGFSNTTYKNVLERLERDGTEVSFYYIGMSEYLPSPNCMQPILSLILFPPCDYPFWFSQEGRGNMLMHLNEVGKEGSGVQVQRDAIKCLGSDATAWSASSNYIAIQRCIPRFD